jgi:lipopolysaccharide transport system ATP-binding protein
MTEDLALSVSHLSKRFSRDLARSLAYGVRDIVDEFTLRSGRARPLRRGEFLVLDDVSFEVRRGEALGVLGRNGAGKSTLLGVLHGLLKPDLGRVCIVGKVSAMIELGAGFNPVLTGRENIRVIAAVQGIRGRELDSLCEDALEFAELSDVADAAYQTYSSGMKARLAYGLSASLKPDVLLVDEVLSVGDFAFQRKCMAHMRSFLNGGGTLLMVSHQFSHVQALCDRAIVLDQGRLVYDGSAVGAVSLMLDTPVQAGPPRVLDAKAPLVIHGIECSHVDGGAPVTGEPMQLTVRYEAREVVEMIWGFDLWTAGQQVCVTGGYDLQARTLEPGVGELHCIIVDLPLAPGLFTAQASMVDAESRVPLALFGWNEPGHDFRVTSPSDLAANAQRIMNHLVKSDIQWERPPVDLA